MRTKALNLFLIFALLFCCGKTLHAQALQRVRVHLFSRDNLQSAKISSATTPTLLLKAVGDQIQVQAESTKTVPQVLLEASPSNPISITTEEEGTRKFSGRIKIRAHQSRLRFVEELPLEDYVRGVLASEMPQDFPLEALKAQAVLARTYAMANRNRHQEEGFQFCDLTHCQAYGGWGAANEKLDAAVKSTRSFILTYHGEPVEALYHSTCGGHTSPNQKVFGGRPLPYLQGVSDGTYCSASPHSNWESSVALPVLSRILDSKNSFSGEIKNLREADHEVDGRVFSLTLEGDQAETITTEKYLSLIGQNLGWNQIKSNWFHVEVKNDEANFKGHGLGHGVGLCQWGAKGMAEKGKKINEILAHYFPGTQLTRRGGVYPPNTIQDSKTVSTWYTTRAGRPGPYRISALEPLLNDFEKIRSDPQLKTQLEEIVKVGVRQAFGEKVELPKNLLPIFFKQIPVFITAKKGAEVRGCMGALKPKKISLTEEILQNLQLAFFKDPRHRPVHKEELDSMEIFITAVGTPTAINHIENASPSRDGILIRHGNKEAILLPGEAKTQRYLLAALKSKAGIRRSESYQLYRVPSVTIDCPLP